MSEYERRVYPRIESSWKLFVEDESGRTEEIGHVQDISLSAVSLQFSKAYALRKDRHRLTLKLRNPHLHPSEQIIKGLKEWEFRTDTEVFVGLSLEKLAPQDRRNLVRFLSRSDRLHVEAILVESASG